MIRWMRYLLAMTLCALSVNAIAQAWPSRPITWIVPYPAGGVTDATSRAVAKRVSEILGTPICSNSAVPHHTCHAALDGTVLKLYRRRSVAKLWQF